MKSLIAIAALSMFGLAGVSRGDDQVKPTPYPLEICFISGDKLGEMGKPFVFVYEGQEIKMCCKDCKKQFDKDPAAAMKKFQEAVKAKSSGTSHSMDNMQMP